MIVAHALQHGSLSSFPDTHTTVLDDKELDVAQSFTLDTFAATNSPSIRFSDLALSRGYQASHRRSQTLTARAKAHQLPAFSFHSSNSALDQPAALEAQDDSWPLNKPDMEHTGHERNNTTRHDLDNLATSPRRHRHKRSAAISQDLSGFMSHSPEEPKPEPGRELSTAGIVETAGTIQSRPRPVSYASSGSDSTVRDLSPLHDDSPLGDDPLVSRDIPRLTVTAADDDVPLDENFDHDPTSSINLEPTYSGCPRPRPHVLHIPPYIESDAPYSPAHDVIDLDAIDAEACSASSSAFDQIAGFSLQQKQKRASMHSQSTSSGFMGQFRHRRAESAPSLAPPSFPARFQGGSAAALGFEMQKVFEEDEENDSESDNDASEPPTPPAVALLPPAQIYEDRDRVAIVADDLPDLPRPVRPFAAMADAASTPTSTSSSPRCAHSASSARSWTFRSRPSADDLPSLVSSGSTVASRTHSTLPTTRAGSSSHSRRSSLGGASGSSLSFGRTESDSFAARFRRHGKHRSLVGLSRLMGVRRRGQSTSVSASASAYVLPLPSATSSVPALTTEPAGDRLEYSPRGNAVGRVLKFLMPRRRARAAAAGEP